MREESSQHYFTLEEANALLPTLRIILAQILRLRQSILDKQPEVWPVIEKAAGNGGSKAANLVEQEFLQLNGLVHQVQEMGAVLKDLNRGLVDFPATREGRDFYLCWQYGEAEVGFWHDIDSGFAGRQPI